MEEYRGTWVGVLGYMGSGVSRISFLGGSKYFCKSGGICMAQSTMQRVALCHVFVRGVRGHARPRKFFKMVQFGALWRIFC